MHPSEDSDGNPRLRFRSPSMQLADPPRKRLRTKPPDPLRTCVDLDPWPHRRRCRSKAPEHLSHRPRIADPPVFAPPVRVPLSPPLRFQGTRRGRNPATAGVLPSSRLPSKLSLTHRIPQAVKGHFAIGGASFTPIVIIPDHCPGGAGDQPQGPRTLAKRHHSRIVKGTPDHAFVYRAGVVWQLTPRIQVDEHTVVDWMLNFF